jgi:hypothetical protein
MCHFDFYLAHVDHTASQGQKTGCGIERIIASVYNAQGDLNNALTNSDLLLGTRQKFTPYAYQVLLIDNKYRLLRQQQTIDEPNSSLDSA